MLELSFSLYIVLLVYQKVEIYIVYYYKRSQIQPTLHILSLNSEIRATTFYVTVQKELITWLKNIFSYP